jgi:hypothetical protein
VGSWVSTSISGYAVSGGQGQIVTNYRSFAAGKTVDSQIPTRLQYNLTGTTRRDRLKVVVRFSETAQDWVANKSLVPWPINTQYWTTDRDYATYGTGVRLYIISSRAFPEGHVPSRAEILTGGSQGQGAVRVLKPTYSNTVDGIRYPGDAYGTPIGAAPSGSVTSTATWELPYPNTMNPNTKYWVMIMPTRAKYRSDGTTAIREFTPLAGHTANGNGSALSFWTNRKQNAPVITSPVSGAVIPPGSNFDLTVDFNDPDQISSSPGPDYSGVNGVQVQYRPRPTAELPNPAWLDMPFYSSNVVAYGPSPQPGWSILGSTIKREMAAQLIFGTVPVRVGGDPSVVSSPRGYLPAGNWQIRVRSFDPGSPYNWLTSNVRPVNAEAKAWSPNNYFSDLISPWSALVNITVPPQVPIPIAISPINDVAIPEGQDVELTWNYRNTGVPPFPQAERVVQYREVGATDWITLVSGLGSVHSATLDSSLLVSGSNYEWQVMVTDSEGEISDWSDPASFWIVPVPQSGGVRPLPEDTIDGGTLGCGKNRAFIYRRGGKVRVAEITEISHLDWGRVRDDISSAQVIVSGWTVDCGNLLSRLQTWAYEVVIFRDNGYTVDRVWEGPITKLTYEQDRVVIDAKDVMVYPYRRIIKQPMNDTQTGGTVTQRAVQVLQNVLGPDDPNVLPYLTPIYNSDDARQYRSIPAYSRTAFEEIDDMAANAGLDYTAVGRSILVWSTKHRIGTLQEFKDADFGAPPIISEYGMSMANVYSVSDGNGLHGEATRTDADGKDPIYGLVEMLSSTWASDTQDEHGTLTQEGMQTVIESFEDFAERSIADRYPPPVVVRVPDNTSLNPDAVVSIQQLVPGVVIPLRATGTLRTVVGNQKLDSVSVVEEAGTETVSITMSPFSRDDTSVVEGEEA